MDLKITTRVSLGKKVKKMRAEGIIPAEVYGRSIKNEHVSISEKDFGKIFKTAGENTIINLEMENGKKIPVSKSKDPAQIPSQPDIEEV